MTDKEKAWLETVEIGEELSIHGPKGAGAFGVGLMDLERAGYISVTRDHYGLKVIRLR